VAGHFRYCPESRRSIAPQYSTFRAISVVGGPHSITAAAVASNVDGSSRPASAEAFHHSRYIRRRTDTRLSASFPISRFGGSAVRASNHGSKDHGGFPELAEQYFRDS